MEKISCSNNQLTFIFLFFYFLLFLISLSFVAIFVEISLQPLMAGLHLLLHREREIKRYMKMATEEDKRKILEKKKRKKKEKKMPSECCY